MLGTALVRGCWKPHANIHPEGRLPYTNAANCWHHLKTKTLFLALGIRAVKDQCFRPMWSSMKIRANVHSSLAPSPIRMQLTAPFCLPCLYWSSGVHFPIWLEESWQDAVRLALALGVPATAVVNSYQEVYWEHSYLIRCVVERELVWLPAHWELQQAPPFASPVKLYQDFLLPPHHPAHGRFPGALDGLLRHRRCHWSI